jgi:rhodanese-related sulfurtransferase
MLRDRLKEVARKAALRAFGMEREAAPRAERPAGSASFDPGVIPKIVDGSGDTPGPNHKEDLGRTWLAAQIASGVAPVLVDLRHPKECAGGMLPGAINLPGRQIEQALDRLVDRERGIVVYDQLGRDEAIEVAAWLRGRGYTGARRLVGGYAEWIEHDEPVAAPQPPPGGRWHIGTEVERRSGGRGFVQEATIVGGVPRYTLLLEDGSVVPLVAEDDLVR